ncbi:hypothetical protein GCM10023231_01630 [Olivibacter ginsenosidimutans]|uniref:FAD-binding FR-type domain-containing protein n=2 Tax=Olivibacter ginsenosidimutans TaxID=1176537 RepID=A0ABP9ACX9_9SPHI
MITTKVDYLSETIKRIQFSGNFKDVHVGMGSFIDFRVSDTDARRYTISYVDTTNGLLELIVHLHGNAPGSCFMDSLGVGDDVHINPPRAYNYYDSSVEKYVIFGDETSLALVCSFLPVLTQHQHSFQFYLELDEENHHIPNLLQLKNYAVFSKNGSFSNENWISALPLVQSPEWQQANFILTGNAQSVRTFRKVLKGKSKGKIVSHGYWLQGKKGL